MQERTRKNSRCALVAGHLHGTSRPRAWSACRARADRAPRAAPKPWRLTIKTVAPSGTRSVIYNPPCQAPEQNERGTTLNTTCTRQQRNMPFHAHISPLFNKNAIELPLDAHRSTLCLDHLIFHIPSARNICESISSNGVHGDQTSGLHLPVT